MALASYLDLQTAIMDEVNRSDLADSVTKSTGTIEGIVTRAITRCEVRLNRVLRVRQMEASTSIAFTGGVSVYALPTDFLSAEYFYLNTDPVEVIKQDSLANIFADYPESSGGEPRSFAVVGSNLQVRPPPDGAYTAVLTYYQRIPALSTSNTTNWLLTDAPDLYVYGSCLELQPWLGADARIGVWAAALEQGVDDLESDNASAKFSGVLVSTALPDTVII